MPTIDRALVERIAVLSRLQIEATEVDLYTRQLQGILTYVDLLGVLDVEKVQPLTHPLENPNVFREDEVRPSMPVQKVLENAPDKVEMFFKVPKVIED